jgi:hypothetical protein
MTTKPIFSAFNQGQIPTIACFNKAKTKLPIDLDDLIAAMQTYVADFVAPVWGTPAILAKTTNFQPGAWAMVFLDDAEQAGELAVHDLTPDGLPVSRVFVKTILKNNSSVSIAASHELVEMLVDPAINLMTTGPDEAFYAYESADPVEADDLSFEVKGIPMSDFVYPSYFEDFHKPNSVKFDQSGQVSAPFEILQGGYQIIFKDGNWSQIFAARDESKKKAFASEDRRGHRSEQRVERRERMELSISGKKAA